MTDKTDEMLSPTLVRRSVLIEDDAVRILDRRVFPFEVTWVTCRTYEDVARAIEEMVTQSSGPFFAAAGGMVLAARAAEQSAPPEQLAQLEQAARRLIATRKTNNHISLVVAAILASASRALSDGGDVRVAVESAAREQFDEYLGKSRRLGAFMADRIADGDTISILPAVAGG